MRTVLINPNRSRLRSRILHPRWNRHQFQIRNDYVLSKIIANDNKREASRNSCGCMEIIGSWVTGLFGWIQWNLEHQSNRRWDMRLFGGEQKNFGHQARLCIGGCNMARQRCRFPSADQLSFSPHSSVTFCHSCSNSFFSWASFCPYGLP